MGKIINDLFDDLDVNVNFVGFYNDKFCIRTFERGVFSETLAWVQDAVLLHIL